VGGTAGTKVAYFTAGALAAGLIVGAVSLLTPTAEDEERPPIIVRGGSLIFQDGDPNGSGEPGGVDWIQVGNDYQPNQPNGIRVSKFTVQLRGGTPGQCPAVERTREFTVTYKEGENAPVTFRVFTKGRPGGSGGPAPTVGGTDLQIDQANRKLLSYGQHGKGDITRIQFTGIGGNVDCQGPGISAKVWQDR
jgi:hypothetical protein